jgi:hypothetical protein
VPLLVYVAFTYSQSATNDFVNFPQSVIDAGDMPENGYHTYLFPFQNITSQPLKVYSIKTSSPCFTSKGGWNKLVPPNGWDTLEFQYNTDYRPGMFTKTATIAFEGSNEFITLIVKGNVVPYSGKISLKIYPQLEEVKRDRGMLTINKTISSYLILQVQNKDTFPMKLETLKHSFSTEQYTPYFCNTPTLAKDYFDVKKGIPDKYFETAALQPGDKTYLIYLYDSNELITISYAGLVVNDEPVTLVIHAK